MIWDVVAHLPRLFWFSFFPQQGGAYSQFSLQRCLIMLVFWPVFLSYLLVTGLCLGLDNCLFPDFRRLRVKAPVLVIGIPRSGTTFLHRLLAGDKQRFTTLSLKELIFAPSILQRLILRKLNRIDQKVGAPCSHFLAWAEEKLFAGLDDVHRTRLDQPEEDYLALTPILACFLLILPFGDPFFLRLNQFDHLASSKEKTQLKKFYTGLIQRHLYVHGQTRTFLSKNPSFTPMFETLAEAFPDARFIACIRTPTEAVPSQLSSMLIGARIFSGRVDQAWWREKLSNMLQYYYAHLLDDFANFGENHCYFVRMESLATDPVNTLKLIYKNFELSISESFNTWLAQENSKAKTYRSTHYYQGEALGIRAKDLQTQFGFVYKTLNYSPPETA